MLTLSTSTCPRQNFSAWTTSICMHVIAVAAAITILRDLPQTPRPTYRMEFLLTESHAVTSASSRPQDRPISEPPASTPVQASQSTSTPSGQTHTQPSVVEPTPLQHQPDLVSTPVAVPQETTRLLTSHAEPLPDAQAPIEHPIEPLTPAIVPPEPAVSHPPQAIDHPSPTASSSVALNPPDHTTTPTIQKDERAALSAHPMSSQNTPSQSDVPPHDHPAQASASSATAADSTSAAVAVGNSSHSNAQSDPSIPPSSSTAQAQPEDHPNETVSINHPPITRTLSGRPDYGWLKDLLRNRITSLQAYPRLARRQGWEGIVVVKATIKHDGSLLNAIVTESSGYAALDEDALALIRRACPLRLQYELAQSHIDVMVPVHYRLDH